MTSHSGVLFRVATFGESHGGGVGVVVDGCPPRLAVSLDAIQADLDRRRPGQSRLVTQRDESDQVEVLSGLHQGYSTGTPIALLVRNNDQNSGAYEHLAELYRPSHADFTYDAKYGIRTIAGGGRASARETIGRVAGGSIARQLLATACGIEVLAWVSSIHTIDAGAEIDSATVTLAQVESDPTRCPSPTHAAAMTEAIEQARRNGDSLGGIVTCVARRVPPGLGEPVFDKLEADLAKAILSLPASRGIEFGAGFGATTMTGREHNDPFAPGEHGQPRTTSNHSGGIQGGISNGADIVLRVAFKPTGTIATEQETVTRSGESTTVSAKGRHDPCVLPRAIPLVEAAVCLTLADHLLRQRATDFLPEVPPEVASISARHTP